MLDACRLERIAVVCVCSQEESCDRKCDGLEMELHFDGWMGG